MLCEDMELVSGRLLSDGSSGYAARNASWGGGGGGKASCWKGAFRASVPRSQSVKLSRKPKMFDVSDAENSSADGGTLGGSGKSSGSKDKSVNWRSGICIVMVGGQGWILGSSPVTGLLITGSSPSCSHNSTHPSFCPKL